MSVVLYRFQRSTGADILNEREAGDPTAKQLQEITRLEKQVDKIDQALTDILKIADNIKDKTIDSILGKSDMELTMDVLMGNLKIPE